MKFVLKSLWILCALCGPVLNAFALDREAFSITKYDLNLQIDPGQHRLGVRGMVTLRNDAATAQRIAILQISSSLDWRAVKAGDKAVQFVTQPFTSDTDHTGSLSEAVVTLPQALAPHATIDLEIAYEGVILPDATRLTRIGTPKDAAAASDWDQISADFTALRGAGYVVWYPIATDVANLSDGDSLFEVVARWKARETGSKMHLRIVINRSSAELPQILFGGITCSISTIQQMGLSQHIEAECLAQSLRLAPPSLVMADYQVLERPSAEVYFLHGHDASAARFGDVTEKVLPTVTDWFGSQRERAKIADLPGPDDAPYENGALLMTPLSKDDSKLTGLVAAHQLTHAAFLSFRPWIEEGLAHFAQALYLEQQQGRRVALDYMGMHRSVLTHMEPSTTAPRSEDETRNSLVNTTNEELYRSKAMCVWWMLRDMIGPSALKKAIAAYRPEEDKEPSYMPRLIAAQTQRDLEWFFDDWVYRDRGLPDFKVASAFSRKTMNNSYMLTITVENLGSAGAEVPVIIKFQGGELMKRLEIRAHNKATTRIETPTSPQEIVVNDGSVPESDATNNVFRIEAPEH